MKKNEQIIDWKAKAATPHKIIKYVSFTKRYDFCEKVQHYAKKYGLSPKGLTFWRNDNFVKLYQFRSL